DRLVRLSGGSPGRALALADPDLWLFRRELINQLLQSKPNGVTLARSWFRFVEEAGKEGAAQRRRATLTLSFLIDFLEQALLLGVGGTPQVVEPDDSPAMQKLIEGKRPEQILEMLDRCEE